MRCSVTVLGARNGADAASAAAKVVDYLKGKRADHGNPLRKASSPEMPASTPDGPSRYFGDSAEGAGRWLGSGFGDIRLSGAVDGEAFEKLLLGHDPVTGEQLISNAGSAARANGTRASVESARLDADGMVGLREAAELIGVGRSYLQKIAKATSARRAVGEEVPTTFLDAIQSGPNRRWEVSGAELHRFVVAREGQSVVLGYDVTFSCPKSVSLLWAIVDPGDRAEILAAIESSVTAGIAYLEENGCAVKVGSDLVAAGGFQAAGFLHATSRALDPQLHWHCVVLNATTGPTGNYRAIDARGLFAHAKTAGYLAAAHLRHELTARLGVDWEESINGNADIRGIDRATVEAFSKRSTEIGEVADAAGLHSAAARQSVALSTRSAKEAVDTEGLIDGWHRELRDRGFDPDRIEELLGRPSLDGPVTATDLDHLSRRLLGAHGLTELSSVFDRRDVIQAVSEWAGHRLTAEDIAAVADEFLTRPQVVTLGTSQTGRPGSTIRRSDGRTVTSGTAPIYTCEAMLEVEARIVKRFESGFDAGAVRVPTDALEVALRSQPSLGADQRAMVEAICTSGDRVQCVLGPAGAGKTFALEVATRAWESQGHRVVGVAVAGVAAEVLARSLGVETNTVASLLTRLDLSGPSGVLDDRTAIVVDEASTIGTRDLGRLLAWAEETGAAVRLVGDPAQHSSVASGGMFRHLVEAHPDRVPTLTENRRQRGPEMAEVRLALDDYRRGKIVEALTRLDLDQRVVTADSADELLDSLVADWFVDRERHSADPDLARSSMVAEHHFERRELNARARALLEADGTLHGPALDAAGHQFRAGDEVLCRAQDRTLRPEGGDRRSYIRNGTRGVVVAVDSTPGRDGLLVDFDGKGEVFVPRAFLEKEVRSQLVGGLTHAYALTSHASQGETYESGRHLATDQSSREGVYVGLTRGRSDVRLYTVSRSDLVPRIDDDPGLPRLEQETKDARDAVAARLASASGERLATEHDSIGSDARSLRDQIPAAELHHQAINHPENATIVHAWESRRLLIAAEARHRPRAEVTNTIGPRPGAGASRGRWDRAAAAIAEHHAVHVDETTPDAVADWSQIQSTIDVAAADRSQIEGPEPTPTAAIEVPDAGLSVGTLPMIDLER